ncbi:MAG: hypothetical protein HY069_01665 [Chlamydiia bacterium]|nr:hypothetical protein [Chlamydiia bacterium]
MKTMPLYDIARSVAENAAKGPIFDEKIPERTKHKPVDFLGFSLHSRIGVAAGPLLNAKWVSLASQLGWDLLIYRTIRNRLHLGFPPPNIVYVERMGDHRVKILAEPPLSLADCSVTVSFDSPSPSQLELLEDINKAKGALQKGQVLVVPVVGDSVNDFVSAALLAKEAGAHIIEANYTSFYMSSDQVFEYTRKLSAALGTVPLIVKVGHFANHAQMEQILIAAAKGGAQALSGILPVPMEVVNDKGQCAFGEKRKTAGIAGGTIRPTALHFVRDAARIIQKEKLELTLLGCGGILLPAHFDLFFEAGADVALSGTGFLWDPYLASKYHG